MKPYFAKYLPVEGEIKEGCIARNNLDGITGIVTRPLNEGEIRDKEYSKVKLFLCTRNIQVGDSFLFKLGYGEYQEKWVEFKTESETETHWNCSTSDPVVTPLGPIQSFHKNSLPLSDPNFIVKVIGEISPNAKWVKEGDEFDYQDVRISYSCEKGDECDLYFGEQLCSAPHELLNPIQIKGPCGHFH